jgi:NAD(P)-dependent dehydrogenase (short-subunit alcohol dehydrogenase family)
VAVVTGGGRGIGREYCLMLAAQGAKVIVNDLGGASTGGGQDFGPAQAVVAEIKAAGGEAIANGADVSDWNAAQQMIDAAVKTYGKLDILINNAGILRDRVLVNMSESDWDQVIKVHLKGTYAPSHHAANHWRKRSKELGGPVDGCLINTSSTSGIYARNIGQSNYGAAKAAIACFTLIVARELERYGVTVNAIAPGAITRLTEEFSQVKFTDDMRESLSPKWIAPVAVWLASERGKAVTGRVFEVAGDTIALAEGWHRVASARARVEDPNQVEGFMAELLKHAASEAKGS